MNINEVILNARVTELKRQLDARESALSSILHTDFNEGVNPKLGRKKQRDFLWNKLCEIKLSAGRALCI